MIVFAGFVPHSPLFVPTIGAEHRETLAETLDAFRRMADDLYAALPDTIVICSSHRAYDDAHSINLADKYRVDFSAFGDITTHRSYSPDLHIVDSLQRSIRRQGFALSLDTHDALDHGTAVALTMLAERLPNIKIIPICYGGTDPKSHFAFGRALKDILAASSRRVAVIATGDLSHALSEEAPEGFRPEGKQFDALVQGAIEHMSASILLSVDAKLVEQAAECGYRPLLLLLGVLDGMMVDPEILCYEAPFGVGYLTAEFHLA